MQACGSLTQHARVNPGVVSSRCRLRAACGTVARRPVGGIHHSPYLAAFVRTSEMKSGTISSSVPNSGFQSHSCLAQVSSKTSTFALA